MSLQGLQHPDKVLVGVVVVGDTDEQRQAFQRVDGFRAVNVGEQKQELVGVGVSADGQLQQSGDCWVGVRRVEVPLQRAGKGCPRPRREPTPCAARRFLPRRRW